MPYIVKERRTAIDAGATPENAGELNYRLTMTILKTPRAKLYPQISAECHRYLNAAELCYQRINDVLGALAGSALEYQRRTKEAAPKRAFVLSVNRAVTFDLYDSVFGPYEDKAILKNGDISYVESH